MLLCDRIKLDILGSLVGNAATYRPSVCEAEKGKETSRTRRKCQNFLARLITHFWLSALLSGKHGGLVSSCIKFGEHHALKVYY